MVGFLNNCTIRIVEDFPGVTIEEATLKDGKFLVKMITKDGSHIYAVFRVGKGTTLGTLAIERVLTGIRTYMEENNIE